MKGGAVIEISQEESGVRIRFLEDNSSSVEILRTTGERITVGIGEEALLGIPSGNDYPIRRKFSIDKCFSIGEFS